MANLAVIPSDSIKAYLDAGYERDWLKNYFNPRSIFDKVYLLSPLEENNPDLLGMRAIKAQGRNLRKLIRRLDIDIVRAYGGYWACDMACNNKVNNVPVVVSVHDSRPKMLFNSVKEADVVFCMSEAVKKTVSEKFNRSEKVWTLPNRVNFDIMKPYPKASLSDLKNKFPFKYKIIHVGRKSGEKNLDTVIRALKILGDQFCLLAIGRGKPDEYLELALSQGVKDRCFFIESINNNELARYYSLCDCMCTPSRSEGFGIVFIEALACEAIVVTSDIAPMNEYITNMQNGLLVKDYEDPRAIAESIKIACRGTGLRKFIKKNCRESVRRFEKEKIDYLEAGYYSKVLEMKRNNEFVAPVQKRILWNLNDYAKNFASLIKQ